MRGFVLPCAALAAVVGISQQSLAGPYTEVGIPGSSPAIAEWANSVTSFTRGPQNIASPGTLASFGASSDAIGPANGTGVVSLGDGGQITLGFASPITNGAGADFAVFENSFVAGIGVFAELGYVEVSSNGTDFFRFPSVSLTPSDVAIGSFGIIDPTDIHNLAGKHVANTGTPFDLADLVGASPLLDVNAITAVRVIDVVGSINPVGSFTPSLDSQNHIINDPYPTAFASGGFDMDGVAVINATVPEPTGLFVVLAGMALARRRRAL